MSIVKRLGDISHQSTGAIQVPMQTNGKNPYYVRELIGEVYNQPVDHEVIKVCRAFVSTQDETTYTGIGWILHDGVSYCMICCTYLPSGSTSKMTKNTVVSGNGSPRSLRCTASKKFNCSTCGIVVCAFCSSHKVYITELCDNKDVADEGMHRVCDNCYAFSVKGKVSAIQCYNMVPRGLPLGPHDSARLHLQFMKYITSKPASELQSRANSSSLAILSRKAILFGNEVEEAYKIGAITSDRVCVDKARGLVSTVQRIYLEPPTPNDYSSLGWVIKSSAHRCMSCQKVFIGDDVKYHCKACGDVCCRHCTNYRANITELKSPFKKRVCGQCYDGSSHEISVRRAHAMLTSRMRNDSNAALLLQHANSHVTTVDETIPIADDDSIETKKLFGGNDRGDSPTNEIFAEAMTFDGMRDANKDNRKPNAFALFLQSLFCGCGAY